MGKKKLSGFDGFSDEYLLTVDLDSVKFFTAGEKRRLEQWRAKGERDAFLKSPEWRSIREHVFERDGKVCSKCGSVDRPCIDHVLPRSKFKELQLNPQNLRVLCWPCNKEKGTSIEDQSGISISHGVENCGAETL